MQRRSHRLFAAALVATLPLGLVACGDEEEAADETTTTAGPEPCDQVYEEGTGDPEPADAVADRSAPEMSACEPSGEGMLVVDEIVGAGAEVPAGAAVTVQYAGVAAATGVEFDSSWVRGAPASFGLNEVIQGWSEGLVGMKEGGRRTLVIPPELAYGDSGPAPGDSLVFTVDLISVDTPAGPSAPVDTTTTTTAPAG